MYICGRNVAKEYLLNNVIINNIYLQENFSDQEILRLIEKKKYNVKIVKKYELDKMTKENHQGIILKVNDFKYSDLDSFTKKDDSLVVLLDHIEDPHNFGAIIRTCEAANVDGIIIPKNRSVDVNSTVIRTSVGATKYVPVAQVTNIKSTIDKLKKDGYKIFRILSKNKLPTKEQIEVGIQYLINNKNKYYHIKVQ